MEDETITNGGVSKKDEFLENDPEQSLGLKRNGISEKDQEVEDLDLTRNEVSKEDRVAEEIADLNRKVEVMEQEKSGLLKENEDQKNTIKVFTDSVEGFKTYQAELNGRLGELQAEIDRSGMLLKEFEEDKMVLKNTRAREAELENENARLRRDLVSSVAERDERVTELQVVKDAFQKLEKRNAEKELKAENLVKEKALMMEQIQEVGEELHKLKMISEIQKSEFEHRINDLEEKLAIAVSDLERARGILEILKEQNGVLEIRLHESGEEAETVKSKVEALKNKIEEKESTIFQLQRDLEALTFKSTETESNLHNLKNEKEVVETVKIALEEILEELSEKFEKQRKLLTQAEEKNTELETKLSDSTAASEAKEQGMKETLKLKEEEIGKLMNSSEKEIAELRRCVEKLEAEIEASNLEKSQMVQSLELVNQENSLLEKRVVKLQEELPAVLGEMQKTSKTHESCVGTNRALKDSIDEQVGTRVAEKEKESDAIEDGGVGKFPWPAAAASTGTIAAAAFMVYLKYGRQR